jgi:hypothetical protein
LIHALFYGGGSRVIGNIIDAHAYHVRFMHCSMEGVVGILGEKEEDEEEGAWQIYGKKWEKLGYVPLSPIIILCFTCNLHSDARIVFALLLQ